METLTPMEATYEWLKSNESKPRMENTLSKKD